MESDTHGQRWSAWFLWKEGPSTADIHRRLQGVCHFILMLPSGATINGPRYVLTLRRLRRAIHQKRPGKWASGVLLQHDNARPHTSAYTMSNIASLGFQPTPHPPYSPDLAPSDYHLFGAMKKPLLKGKRFADQTALQQAVRTWRHNVPQQC